MRRPTAAVLMIAAFVVDAPLRTRWMADRDAFAVFVAGKPIPPPGSKWTKLDVPTHIGSYLIADASWVPGGAIFHEAEGGFASTGGFAYLPGGPTRELREHYSRVTFRSLRGGWYSWVEHYPGL